MLAKRLEEAQDISSATVCYMCAGNIEKTVSIWLKGLKQDKESLQDLIEKVLIFQQTSKKPIQPTKELVEKYAEFAQMLAEQGLLELSLRFLNLANEASKEEPEQTLLLRYRIYNAIVSFFLNIC